MIRWLLVCFFSCLSLISCVKQETDEITVNNSNGYLSGFNLERCYEHNSKSKQDSLLPRVNSQVAKLRVELDKLYKVMESKKLERWNSFVGGNMSGAPWGAECIENDIIHLESTVYKNYRFNKQCKNHLKTIFKTAYFKFKDNSNLRKLIIHEMRLDSYGKEVIGRDVTITITPVQMDELLQFQSYEFFQKKYWSLYECSDNSDQFPFLIKTQDFR